MQASTPEKALLRYLYCRELKTEQETVEVSNVLKEIEELEKEVENLGIALTLKEKDRHGKYYFLCLDQLSMVNYDSKTSSAQLTELGRGFASQLVLPGGLEKAIPKVLN